MPYRAPLYLATYEAGKWLGNTMMLHNAYSQRLASDDAEGKDVRHAPRRCSHVGPQHPLVPQDTVVVHDDR